MSGLRIQHLGADDRATIRDIGPGIRICWHRFENETIYTESAVMRTHVLEAPRVPMPPAPKMLELEFMRAWLFLWPAADTWGWPAAYGLVWVPEGTS